ncbi:MAG: hypothetical protein IPM60_10810 [Rhodospirillales bacterium]|nr:hypothetical protein [Rhodospirillales bacterium]
MKLGGWSRLWIVISALYFAAIVVLVSTTLPQAERVAHAQVFYDRLSPDVRQRILAKNIGEREAEILKEALRRELIEQVEMPNGHFLTFSKDLPEGEKEDAARAYWTVVERTAADERFQYIVSAIGWWIGPVIALYVIGWTVGWVYSGFKTR